jgi:REP element-mobilizing transposase RayT
MARLGRIVAAGFPHHVTQRGNRRQTIFFEPADYALYRDLLAERCHKASVEVWAYCLMPNHVHLVLTPTTPEGLARAIAGHEQRGARNGQWVRCPRNSPIFLIKIEMISAIILPPRSRGMVNQHEQHQRRLGRWR